MRNIVYKWTSIWAGSGSFPVFLQLGTRFDTFLQVMLVCVRLRPE